MSSSTLVNRLWLFKDELLFLLMLSARVARTAVFNAIKIFDCQGDAEQYATGESSHHVGNSTGVAALEFYYRGYRAIDESSGLDEEARADGPPSRAQRAQRYLIAVSADTTSARVGCPAPDSRLVWTGRAGVMRA